MIRSLFSSWKQVIYYRYDQPMKKKILLDIITCLHDINYTVVAVVSDMGPGNMSVWNEFDIGISPKKTYFQHPCNSNLQIFVFADALHLLKLLRNHFLDHGFNMEGRVIHTKSIEKFLVINCNDLKIAFAISTYHLNVQGSERQKVLPAVQLLSNKTSAALE